MNQNYPKQITITLDKKHWKTVSQIAAELGSTSAEILPILHYGSNSILTFNGYEWKIKKKAKSEDIQLFSQLRTSDIQVEPSELLIYQKIRIKRQKIRNANNKKSKRSRLKSSGISKSNVHRNELDSVSEEFKLIAGSSRGHGFSYGKKKLYDGPSGQYWNDPNFKKIDPDA